MKRLHILLSLTSLVVVLVSVERFSITARILLEPFDFLRLHEAIQITLLILASTLLPFFVFKAVTDDFALLTRGQRKNLIVLTTLFVVGIYFYASGNAFHELASFLFNQYCSASQSGSVFCQGLSFNDLYVGNGLYFLGAFLITVIPVLIEVGHPLLKMSRRDLWFMLPNALIFAVAIVAYAGFDVVIVGLVYAIITTIVVLYIFMMHRQKMWSLPVTDYTVLTYVIGTVVSCIVRLIR